MAEVMTPVAARKAGHASGPASAGSLSKEREETQTRNQGVLPNYPWAIPAEHEGNSGIDPPPLGSTGTRRLPPPVWNVPVEAVTTPWVNVLPRNRLPLQCKLAVGPVNEPLEVEADVIADRVMRGQRAPTASSASSAVRRKCACEGSGQSCEVCKKDQGNTLLRKAAAFVTPVAAPPIVHEVLRSPGQPLDAPTRMFFEPRFEADFSLCDRALQNATALASGQTRTAVTGAPMILASCGQAQKAEANVARLNRDYPPQIRARAGLQPGNAAKAIEDFHPAEAYQFGYIEAGIPAYLRGVAYLQNKQGAHAAAEFRKVLDFRGALGAMPYLALSRLGWRALPR